MSKDTIEFDFLGIQKEASKSRFRKNFRVAGMQSAISRMDPAPAQGMSEVNPLQTTPFTIFYNGGVAVFDLPRHQAENILKLAEQVCSKGRDPVGNTKSGLQTSSADQLLDTLNADLPLARKKSLQRFLEKRKERLTSVSC
ncbi:hypothetical protein L6164_015043 [Bauhinia variegata]|uniref:Uncharacterized protein n=1 Tax=Bauhinia variegata TaxID=167791 RepID=A0ACB9NLB1_BAUVA|nr:hypothetical protein L6164_015043 [Bauhinia variegata]